MRLYSGVCLLSLLAWGCASQPPQTGAPLTCEQRATSSNSAISTVQSQHLDCTKDEDCELAIPDTLCGGECPIPINTNGASVLSTEIANINKTTCKTYRADGCMYGGPSCAPAKAVCNNSKCELKLLTP